MRLVLDSSALAKRYISEPGSDAVLAACRAANEIVLSVICVPEILSALNRLRRAGELSDADYLQLKQDFAADIDEAAVVSLNRGVLRGAIVCLEATHLRALDAIHVASAMESACDLFMTADRQQCRAASVLQLPVVDLSGLG